VSDVKEGPGSRSFDPAKDIEPLRAAIVKAGGAAIVIVDPVVSAMAGDSHKNADVRRALQPLVDLCADLGAALLGIAHFSKGTAGRDPVERIPERVVADLRRHKEAVIAELRRAEIERRLDAMAEEHASRRDWWAHPVDGRPESVLTICSVVTGEEVIVSIWGRA
jgi:putative DNA primase/helicase